MFITPHTTILGGAGFSVPPGEKGYLRTATGYPITLEKTLARQAESIVMQGASGGVGDLTINLLDPAISNNMTQVKAYNVGQYEVSVEPNTNYTLWTNYPRNAITGIDVPVSINNVPLSTQAGTNGAWYGQARTFTSTAEGKIWIYSSGVLNPGTTYMRQTLDAGYKYMLVKGEYTFETIPVFEPYGYKIPLLINPQNKTIYIYSDAPLGSGDELILSPKAQTATRGSTVISSLQDWTMQDWTIPKAGSLTVVAGTTFAPSGMEVQYWSSKKAED